MIRPFGGKAPVLAPDVFVAENATLIGDIEIGPGGSVWYGCVLRADVEKIRIGRNTNVQDLSVLHVNSDGRGTYLGDDVTIGHRVVLHACKVGNRSLIGIGAIVLDGAEIGDDVLVGAGALVPPGAKIPSGMLALGAPARAVRPLTDEEKAFIRGNGARYVGYAAQHKGLR